MNIFCRVDDCNYFECGFCKRGDISISEDLECEDYESYLDTEEWKKPFWKRMLDSENNRVCRVRYYGKEVEIKGRTFFAESRSEFSVLTDAITGMSAGITPYVENNLSNIVEAASRVDVPLNKLPVATYDEISRKFTYEEEPKGGAE